jgi:hypothetical protein
MIRFCDKEFKPFMKGFLLSDIKDPIGLAMTGPTVPPSLAPLQKAAKASKKKLEREQQRIAQLLDSDSFLTKVLHELHVLELAHAFKKFVLIRAAMITGSYGYETEKGDKLVNGSGQVSMTEEERTEATAHFKSMWLGYTEGVAQRPLDQTVLIKYKI